MIVQNASQLLNHGCQELRRTALDIAECSLAAADPYRPVRELVHLDGDHLTVGDLSYDLSQHGSIYVFGAGKATLRVAQALEDTLGSRIEQGVVAIKRGQHHKLRLIRVIEASHPYPDESSNLAARAVMGLAQRARAGDIVFTAITGGSSALLCYPAEGITLEEKRQVHELLLKCGADILEINAVRKHLSQVKGGLLARAALPATLINLTVSDVVGDPLDYIAGPVVADTSYVTDALHVLEKYDLWERVPVSVRQHLGRGAQAETPKELDERLVQTFVVVPSSAAANAASVRAEALGFPTLLLTTYLTGESREVGACLAAIVREILESGRPVAPPCAVVASGENTVTVPDGAGRGGPSQEMALSMAVHLQGLPQIAIVCLDTDGTDGPTEFAGALVDGYTIGRAVELGHDVPAILRAHNVTPLLQDVGDLVHTGATGTNVADVIIMVIDR
jgi:glycerate-2-kinase